MQTEQLDLGGISALVWGPPGDGAVVAVHGNLSHKADTPIQLLAEAASARALQVLSFDPVSYTHLDVYKRQYWRGMDTSGWKNRNANRWADQPM